MSHTLPVADTTPSVARRCWPVCVAMLTLAVAMEAQAQVQAPAALSLCGDLRNGYGPFDYRRDKDKLPIVENSHYTPPVQSLVRGVSGPIGAELDYALRAFPNHHRVLMSMVAWGQKIKSLQPPGATYTIECYFDRAIRFAGDDPIPRMIYARFLHSLGRMDDAMAQLDATTKLAGDNPFTHYNAGLIYMEIGQPDKALEQAHRASALGFTRPELREQLERAGKWQEPAK